MEQPAAGKKHPLIVVAEKGKRIIAGILLIMMFVLLSIAVLELIWLPLAIALPGITGGADSLILTEAELLNIFDMENEVAFQYTSFNGKWQRTPVRLTPRTVNVRMRVTF